MSRIIFALLLASAAHSAAQTKLEHEKWLEEDVRYIILGEPRTIQRFYGNNALKEAELWFYQGQEGRGLPAFFYLLFFKRDEVGDYRLYHPLIDGPASLLRGTDISRATHNLAAVEKLEEIDAVIRAPAIPTSAGRAGLRFHR